MESQIPPYELGFKHGAVLIPGGTLEAWIEVNLMLGIPDINDIINSVKALYVVGLLRYFDFAKEEGRELQFCYRYVHKGVSWTAEDGGALTLKAQWVVAGPPDYNTHT